MVAGVHRGFAVSLSLVLVMGRCRGSRPEVRVGLDPTRCGHIRVRSTAASMLPTVGPSPTRTSGLLGWLAGDDFVVDWER